MPNEPKTSNPFHLVRDLRDDLQRELRALQVGREVMSDDMLARMRDLIPQMRAMPADLPEFRALWRECADLIRKLTLLLHERKSQTGEQLRKFIASKRVFSAYHNACSR